MRGTAELPEQQLVPPTAPPPSPQNQQPEWVTPELPPAYNDLARQMAALKQEAAKFESFGALLWQTGQPLVRAVRDVFAAMRFDAGLAENGASYDAHVQLDANRRLLLQVIGSSGPINKQSPKITQILQTIQQEATEHDRIVLVANVYCETPVRDRTLEPVTPDALRLILGLGANLVVASTLFGLWKFSLQDLDDARKSVFSLHKLNGGIYR